MKRIVTIEAYVSMQDSDYSDAPQRVLDEIQTAMSGIDMAVVVLIRLRLRKLQQLGTPEAKALATKLIEQFSYDAETINA